MPKVHDSEKPVGSIQQYTSTTPPPGWLSLNGQTVGSGASGANLAQGYALDLFVHLWNNYSNTDLPILTSGGTPTTRGASGAADFTANKRMPVPNLQGRTLVMAGSYTDPVSGAINRTLGQSIGAEAHLLTSGQSGLPAHGHTIPMCIGVDDNNGNDGQMTGRAQHADKPSTDINAPIAQNGAANAAASHNNMQPSHVVHFMIRY